MESSPYRSPMVPDWPQPDRQGLALLKRVVFALASALSGLVAVYSLWGVIYFHWESTRQLPVEQIEEATYAMHGWFFYLILSTIASVVFAGLFFFAPRRFPAAVANSGHRQPSVDRP